MSTLDAKTRPPRWARVLASGLFGLFVLIAGAAVGLALGGGTIGDEMFLVMAVGYAAVGSMVAAREPNNAIGWLMLATAITIAITGFVEIYLRVSGRPGEVALAWMNGWIWYPWLTLAAMVLPLLFPNGRPLTRRWRPALWIAGGYCVLGMLSSGLDSGPLNVDSELPISNPFGVSGRAAPVIDAFGLFSEVLAAVAIVLAAASLVLRLRRSCGRERLQLKWFAYVGGLGLCALTLSFVAGMAESFSGTPPQWAEVVGATGWFGAVVLIVVGLPIAMGTSMLRHRLYDIDLVIKRTLVYGALTLTLAAVYLALVLGLRSLLNPLTGQSDLAVAASTLAVAALFRPLRTRIQTLVDRRFYRQRYDATQAITAFTGRLRQEVDLDTVTTDLLTVVRHTLQPEHATLWLKDR